MSRLVSVAVPIPGIGLLSYRVPDEFDMPERGARVVVPVGARAMTGIVVGHAADEATSDTRPAAELKDIVDVLDAGAFVPPAVLELALWVGEYYACGPGEALAAVRPPGSEITSACTLELTGAGRELAACGLPNGLRGRVIAALNGRRFLTLGALRAALARPPDRRQARAPRHQGSRAVWPLVLRLEREGLLSISRPLKGRTAAFKMERHAVLTAAGVESRVEPADGFNAAPLGPRQRQAIALLRGAPRGLAVGALRTHGVSAETLQRLVARGLAQIVRRRVERDPLDALPGCSSPDRQHGSGTLELTAEQAAALRRLTELADTRTFKAALLYGVTGSGKTELYLRLAAAVCRTDRAVLMLVPEIALTPAIAGAFRAAFGEAVAIQHSGLSAGERHDQWHRIRSGAVQVVVGTRSAVFAPLARLGLVIVDEEHDASYKQEEAPRYHARDVAVMRARLAGALAVLGSATPSLESYQNAISGRYELLRLPRRVLDRPLAAVGVVDMREEYAAHGPDVVLSGSLRNALAGCLSRREQAIILLNRRGFARAVFCRQCAGTCECANCSVALTVHRSTQRARCHYCNYSVRVPTACPRCAGPYLEQLGFGTERVQAEIVALFPDARVARLDRDAARRRGAAAAVLRRFGAGEVDILIGTQMIAKGHDFPGVTLVGVVSADVGLGVADFRAAERTFQLLTQVAGRAGRGPQPGEAIIQTLYPDHYSIRHACRQDYQSFYEDEIRFRRGMRYPPAVALVNAVIRARSATAALADAADLAARLRNASGAFRVLGPAPAPLERLRGQYRAQLFLKGSSRAAMRRGLADALETLSHLKRRVTIDVDPLSVL